MGVSADDNGLSPAWHETRDALADDWFTEHSATEDVTDGAVRAEPHLLQLELCGQGFIDRYIYRVKLESPVQNEHLCHGLDTILGRFS